MERIYNYFQIFIRTTIVEIDATNCEVKKILVSYTNILLSSI